MLREDIEITTNSADGGVRIATIEAKVQGAPAPRDAAIHP